jgi:predicted metal-dependent hydrolase
MPEIKLGHKTVSYRVRESERARRVSLKIDPRKGLEVVLPSGVDLESIEWLLRDRQQWILKHLTRFGEADTAVQRRYVSGETLFFLGVAYELEVTPTHTLRNTVVARQGNLIRVRLKANSTTALQSAEEVRAALEAWYRQQAKNYISQRAAVLAAQHGFKYENITIKGQRTRWGSCSSQNNLNFNWRLMLAPPGAIDYVILHELCHLRELNHSPRFWKLVAQVCPAYKQWIKWLDEHDWELHL